MKQIPLSNGLFALVDDDDFERLSSYKWHAVRSATKHRVSYYAARGGRDGEPGTVYMHRQVMRAEVGQAYDHRDRDGLNNQKSNLRPCTPPQNLANSRRPNKSGYKGVYWDAQKQKFLAQIQIDGRAKHLGWHRAVEDAARAYDRAALQAYGEFAALNFEAAA